MPNPNLINEEQIPSNWAPESMSPIVPGNAPKGAPAPPVPHDMPQFFSGSMPPALQHDSTFVGTEVGSPRIPKYSLMPLGLQAVALTNAAIQSTASKTPSTVPSTPSVSAVTLNIPSIFTPLTQTVNLPGPLAFTLAPETPGYFFQAPPPGLSGYEGSTGATFLSIVGGGTLTVSQTPTSSSSLGLLMWNAGSSLGTPSGWTAVGTSQTFFKSISGTSPVSVSFTIPSQIDAETSLSLFSGPAPSLVQSSTSNTASGSVSQTNTTGNTIVIGIQATSILPAAPVSIVVSDSLGNIYQQIVNQAFVGNTTGLKKMFQESLWVCANCIGGANVISWAITAAGSTGTPSIAVIEFGPLASGNSIPFFAPISGASLPPINLASTGNGGVGGTLKVPNGGTGQTTLTAHGVLIGEGTSAIAATSSGTSGQVLTSNGAADPTFQGAAVQVSSTSLSSAQLLALVGTPVSLIPTPGPGFTILPLSVSIILFGGSAAYTDAGGAVSFNIGSATQALASNAIFTTATSPNKQIQRVAGFPATDTAGSPPTDDNAAMTISKATNNFAAGNGTAKVIVHYIVMPTT